MGNTSEDFTVDNKKEAGLNGYAYVFSVDYFIIDVDNILIQYNVCKHNLVEH